jgi:hypothetical protein
MADKSVEIKITGLRELNAAFRAVNTDLPKALKVEFLTIAKTIVGVAQQRMPFRTGEAASSLKPVSGATYAGIGRPAGGDLGKGAYYPWLDFGGSTGRGHIAGVGGSGAIKRPSVGKQGRYLYPAIAESTVEIEKAADAALAKVAQDNGFETSGGL